MALPAPCLAQDKGDDKKAIRQDRIIAGGPKDFLEVRHLVVSGTNEEIGRALATLAKERHGVTPEASSDRLRNRAQRRYFEKNYPILHDRMRGVAAACGKRLNDDAWNVSSLPYLLGLPPGCSVVYYPPEVTADGKGVVSRNYDFGTGTLLDARPKAGELPVNSRPYLIELHPDRGHASLALCAFDLLSGVLDGINSEGLTVTMLSDDELQPKYPNDPALDGGVGLDECQVLRFLLDTCANVEEAKEALLLAKQYYSFVPNHYLIADRHGKSFVWEYSHAHNREYIVEHPGKPLISTNFRLHQHLDGMSPPSAKQAKGVCARYCALAEQIAAEPGKLTLDFIKKTHRAADITIPAAVFGGKPPIRTLWHALYFPEQRKMRVSFYLGDEPDPDQPKKTRIRRSDYVEFVLISAKAGKE
ncbi:MAG TPA: C45 family peptidase [Gemmataceae bacterium]|jgi:hypothetical protein|nr:C45 family peptidase [Gemmataceae bacterium]